MASIMDSSNDPIIIDKLRERLVNEMTANSEVYHEVDLERVKSDEWAVKRYLRARNGDPDKAFDLAKEVLKWRKTFEVNDHVDLDAPLEFYKIGALFPYEKDKEGRIVFYIRIKLYKSFPKLSDHLRQFLFHLMNKMDIEMGEKGFVMVWDMRGVGPSNWDLTMVRFLINSFHNLPGALRVLYLAATPWIMNPFIKIAMQLMPEETKSHIKFISLEDLPNFVDIENMPDFLGGKCQKNYREVPEGAKCAYDVAEKNGYTSVEVDKMLKYYDKDLNP